MITRVTSALPPAAARPTPSPSGRRTLRWAPPVGWLLVAAALVVAVMCLHDVTWASGRLGGSELEADADRLLGAEGTVHPVTVVLLYLGLGVGAALGVAAVPATRAERWTLTWVLLTAAVAVTVSEMLPGRSSSSPLEVAAVGLFLFGLPVAVVLVLVWRGARRGAAVSALVCVVVAAGAQLVTVVALGSAPAHVGPGAWVVLAAVLVALAGAVLLERTTPHRVR